MSHLLEILLQLLGFFPPWRTPAGDKSEMARIGNFFGGFASVFLAVVTLGALARFFLL